MSGEVQMLDDDSITVQRSSGLAMFAALVVQISALTKASDKLKTLAEYFTLADNKDKV